MAKITKLEAKTYQGKVTGHLVGLDDGTEGYLNDKGSDTVALGDNVSCTLEVKQNKQGKNYNLLTLKKGTSAPKDEPGVRNDFNPARPKAIEDHKVNAAIEATGFIHELIGVGKIEPSQMEEYQRRAVTLLWKEIDEVFSKK